jgi:glutamate synthase domain-containing protein 3
VSGAGEELRRLLERHARYSGSVRAVAVLERWEEALGEFRLVAPKSNVAVLEDEHEGTLGGGPDDAVEAPAEST